MSNPEIRVVYAVMTKTGYWRMSDCDWSIDIEHPLREFNRMVQEDVFDQVLLIECVMPDWKELTGGVGAVSYWGSVFEGEYVCVLRRWVANPED